MVLAWRATTVRSQPAYAPFIGGPAVGQWRPTGGSCVGDERPGVGIHRAVCSGQPDPVRSWTTLESQQPHYADDFNAVKALGRKTGSTRTDDQTALAPFWEGNASVHWNQAANQIARANHLSLSDSQPVARRIEHRDGRHGIHHLERQAVLRRRSAGGDLAAGHIDPFGRHGRQSRD